MQQKEIKHNVPFASQYNGEHVPDKWQKRACGIVAVKMVCDHGFCQDVQVKTVPVQVLLNTALLNDGYVQDIGWKHGALVELAESNGFKAGRKEFRIPYLIYNYAPKFLLDFVGNISREYGIWFLKKKIAQGVIPIVSLSTKKGGHLVPVVGFGVNLGKKGFYYNDSAKNTQEEGYHRFISYTDFRKKWRRLSILIFIK